MLSRERLQERFIEMIKIYSPSKGEKEMADWIENWLRERNIPFQSDHAGEAYGGNGRNIVAFVKGNTKERPLGFAAHMDQIEPCRNVNPVTQWKHHQYRQDNQHLAEMTKLEFQQSWKR